MEEQIKPEHYKMIIKNIDIQVLDIIKARLTEEEYIGFIKGNIIKYILRADKKNKKIDYKKCSEYLGKLIEEME